MTHTNTHTHTRTHARTHARTRTHTHTHTRVKANGENDQQRNSNKVDERKRKTLAQDDPYYEILGS